MRIKAWMVAAAGFAAMAACGDTATEQALYGAGAGAATAVVLDGNPLTGAIVGTAGNLLYCQTTGNRCY